MRALDWYQERAGFYTSMPKGWSIMQVPASRNWEIFKYGRLIPDVSNVTLRSAKAFVEALRERASGRLDFGFILNESMLEKVDTWSQIWIAVDPDGQIYLYNREPGIWVAPAAFGLSGKPESWYLEDGDETIDKVEFLGVLAIRVDNWPDTKMRLR